MNWTIIIAIGIAAFLLPIIGALLSIKKGSKNETKALEVIHNNNREREDADLIYKVIDKHFFMQILNEQARNEIIITMSLCRIKPEIVLFEQGDPGAYWYIVHKGTLELYIDNKLTCSFNRGDSFGELALMNDAPRVGTVKTVTECEVWVLKREVFRKILDYIFTVNYEENMKFLDTVTLPLDSTFKSILANNLIQQIYNQGEYICRDGEIGNCMFIIKEGEVDVMKGKKVIRTLKKGENFGQKALLEGDRRTMDVVAKTKCKLYSISSSFFESQLGPQFKEKLYYSFLIMSFQTSDFFKGISQQMLSKTFHLFTFKNFKNKEIVYRKGAEMTNVLCAVLEGNLYDTVYDKIEAKRYEFLYPESLTNGKENILRHDLVAEPDCLIAEADYAEFQKALGGDIKTVEKRCSTLNNLDNIALFKNLSPEKLEILLTKLKVEKFDNGKRIINQDESGDKFFIIKEGRVDFFVNSKYVRSLNDGEEFGAKSLLNTAKRTATAVANGTVYCYTITASVFKSILEPNLIAYFQRKIALEDNTIELKDLENIKELGHGNFGSVSLVKSRKNQQFYAVKALDLVQIKKENLQPCVKLEKDVLLKVDHPFIMKMVKYLKNEHFIFFIMEYIKGKELWEVIRDIGLLNKEQTQFYGGSMLLAIDYLHRKGIIYRDIKPENIMVNDMGYIKIIDFGTVKEIKDRTSTIIGTSHYMAPEIVKGAGYSFQVDIWSIAICLYEFFCGKLPFGDDCEEPMDIYRAVAKEDLTFPNFVHDEKFMDLLIKMLKKNPTSRLYKLQQIKEQPYWREFNWNKLISLGIDPPYKIKMKKEKEDTSQMMPYLTYIKGKQHKKQSKTRPSLRQLEFEKWLKDF